MENIFQNKRALPSAGDDVKWVWSTDGTQHDNLLRPEETELSA